MDTILNRNTRDVGRFPNLFYIKNKIEYKLEDILPIVFDSKVLEASSAYINSLSSDEKTAIFTWTCQLKPGEAWYESINRLFRFTEDTEDQHFNRGRSKRVAKMLANRLNDIILKAPITHTPCIVYRGITNIGSFNEGNVLNDPGFKSVTWNPKIALGYGKTVLQIAVPSGTHILYVGCDDEILFPPNARFNKNSEKLITHYGETYNVIRCTLIYS